MNHRPVLFCLISLCLTAAGVSHAAPQNDAASTDLIRDVRIGLSGVSKLGHWTPVRVQIDADRLPRDARLELTTVDSDAVPITYQLPVDADSAGWVSAVACFGRTNAELTVRLVDAQGARLAERSWQRLRDLTELVPATEPLLLQLGTQPDLSPAATLGMTESRRILSAADPGTFPAHWNDFDAVDFLVLSAGDLDHSARSITSDQAQALRQWVEMGGRLLINCGRDSAEVLAAGKPLEGLAPGVFRGLTSVSNSDSLEFFAGSAAGQLITDATTQSIPVAEFNELVGVVEVRQNDLPLLVRRRLGFGEIVYTLFDLEDRLIADWKGNPRLLARLLGSAGQDMGLVKSRPNAAAVNYGFRDLSGQVRATGERFRGVSLVTFLLIASLIVVYAICLGPLDYFILQKFFPGMEWTWVTSTITTLVFAGIAWGLVYYSKPNRVLINHTEILDLDASSSLARGGVWTNIFSPRTQLFDVAVPATGESSRVQPTSGMISSFGLPGDGIGGMESRTVTQLFHDSYSNALQARDAGRTSEITRAPVAVAATKQFYCKWTGTHAIEDLGEVEFRETGRQLGGRFRNPFDDQIRDAVLLYGNTVYMYGDIPPFGTIDLESGTERSLKYFLQSADSEGESPRWSIGDRGIPRVFSMLMFFRLAGGEDFTGLTNQYLNEFDLSEQVALGHAVLLGRIDDRSRHPLKISAPETLPQFDRQTTFVRVVFPVEIIGPTKR